jgi:hypothetical protein
MALAHSLNGRRGSEDETAQRQELAAHLGRVRFEDPRDSRVLEGFHER